jgi:hypothetical protein
VLKIPPLDHCHTPKKDRTRRKRLIDSVRRDKKEEGLERVRRRGAKA